jgi:hypothetical protein
MAQANAHQQPIKANRFYITAVVGLFFATRIRCILRHNPSSAEAEPTVSCLTPQRGGTLFPLGTTQQASHKQVRLLNCRLFRAATYEYLHKYNTSTVLAHAMYQAKARSMDNSTVASEGSRVVRFENQEATLGVVRARVNTILLERGQLSEKRDELAVGGEDYVFGTTDEPSGSSLLFVSVDETDESLKWLLYANQNPGALSRINPTLAVFVKSFDSAQHGVNTLDLVHTFVKRLRRGTQQDLVLAGSLGQCFEVDPDGLATSLAYMQELWDAFLESNADDNASNADGASGTASSITMREDEPDQPSPPSETNVTFVPVPPAVMDKARDGLAIRPDQSSLGLVTKGGHPILRGLLEAHCDTQFAFEDDPYTFNPSTDAHASTLVCNEFGVPFLIFPRDSGVDSTWTSTIQPYFNDLVDLEKKPMTAIEVARTFFHQLKTEIQGNSELNSLLAPSFARDDRGTSTSLMYGQSQASQEFRHDGRRVHPKFSLVRPEDFLDALRTKRILSYKLSIFQPDPLLDSLLQVHLEASEDEGNMNETGTDTVMSGIENTG